MTAHEEHMKTSMELIANSLGGAPSQVWGALESLYRASVSSNTAQWICGTLMHRGDVVEWDHGKGTRSGHIEDFDEFHRVRLLQRVTD